MNIKEAIYQETAAIPKLLAEFGADFEDDQLFQDYRPQEFSQYDTESPKITMVFFEIFDSGLRSKVRNSFKRFKFHIIGKDHQEDDLMTTRDIITDHFLDNFRNGGSIASGFTVKSCSGGGYEEQFDYATKEKILVTTLDFGIIRAAAGNFT